MKKLGKNSQISLTNNQILSPQSQSWILTAQQLQDELTQTQAELRKSKEQLQQKTAELDKLKAQQRYTRLTEIIRERLFSTSK